MEDNTKLKTVDLFSGIGGIRKGFEMTGHWENVLSAEVDPFARLTYTHLYGDDPYNDVTADAFKQLVKDTSYDTLLAGFPCQAFSRAGKKEGFLDATRGTLFFDTAKIIEQTRPKTFLLENVDALVTHDKGRTFATILNVLVKDLNYKIIGVDVDNDGNVIFDRHNFVRNARNFGTPQNRPRVYIMGFDRGYFTDEKLSLLPDILPESSDFVIHKDLSTLLDKEVDKKYYLADGALASLKEHKKRHSQKGNGFGYQVVNQRWGELTYSNALLATGGSGKERNLVFDDSADYGGILAPPKKTPINQEFIRNMTPDEWAKLQGFKDFAFKVDGVDTFTFPPEISDTQKYKQLGNSVSVPVIYTMANFMKQGLIKLGYIEK